MTEGEIIRQHHRLNGHELEQTPGDNGGRGAWRAVVHGFAKSRTQLSNGMIKTTFISSFLHDLGLYCSFFSNLRWKLRLLI